MSPPSADDLRLASELKRLLKGPEKRSLDVGCGTGRLVESFQRAGFRASGMEPNEMAVEAGRKHGRNILVRNLSDVETGSQDCITAMHVLEHTYSPKEFLADCRRILDDHGILIIEVPNYTSRPARRAKEHWQPLYPDTHLYQFTPDTLKRYLRQSGFKPLSVRKVGGGGFLHAPRPVDRSGNQDPVGKPAQFGFLRELIWGSRHLVYRIPLAQHVIRYVFWQLLQQGEFVRVSAVKI